MSEAPRLLLANLKASLALVNLKASLALVNLKRLKRLLRGRVGSPPAFASARAGLISVSTFIPLLLEVVS